MRVPGWLFCVLIGPMVVALFAVLVRQIGRGELGLRGGGVLHRDENPVGFWLYSAIWLGICLLMVGCLVWIGVEFRHDDLRRIGRQ